ncbi:hypothetical protein J6590_090781 [Homalodisca vitripennis]|nr:hypothetical protein J6590_090781 [Homalodisca vitripennis]
MLAAIPDCPNTPMTIAAGVSACLASSLELLQRPITDLSIILRENIALTTLFT